MPDAVHSTQLAGRRVLVTGASRGIGRATALAAARAGAEVVATARTAQALSGVVGEAEALGATVRAVPADLTDAGQVRELAAVAGEIDVLVNNAAAKAAYLSVLGSDDDVWFEHLAVSLLAPVRLVRALAPGMAQRGRGVVITLSSNASVVPIPFIGPYATAKRAADWLTRLIAIELGQFGVRAVSVAPGLTATSAAEMVAASGQLANWMSTTPAGRIAAPEEIADTIVWAAGDDRSYLSGVTLTVDGGHTAGEYNLFDRMSAGLSAADPVAHLLNRTV